VNNNIELGIGAKKQMSDNIHVCSEIFRVKLCLYMTNDVFRKRHYNLRTFVPTKGIHVGVTAFYPFTYQERCQK